MMYELYIVYFVNIETTVDSQELEHFREIERGPGYREFERKKWK